VLRGEGSTIGESVLVIDWRSDWIGIGIAEHLAQQGRSVRLAVSGIAAGETLPLYVRDHSAASLHKLGVKVLPYMRLYGSDSDSVYLQHVSSNEAVVIDEVDTLVLCTGHTPVDELSDSLEDLNVEASSVTPRRRARPRKRSTKDAGEASSRRHPRPETRRFDGPRAARTTRLQPTANSERFLSSVA